MCLEVGEVLMRLTLVLVLENPSVEQVFAFLDGPKMQNHAGYRPLTFLPVLIDEVLLSRMRVRGRSIIYFFIFFTFFIFFPASFQHRLIIVPLIVSLCLFLLLITIVVTDSYN